MMLTAALTAALMTTVSTGIETVPRRDALLAEPRPWPAGRVDSPDRPQNGRLWLSRTPIGNRTPLAEQWYGRRGPAAFGAPAHLTNAVIFVRMGQFPIAVSPWERFDTNGFERFRDAQNLWLREQGLVLKVRTHVNAMYEAPRTADAGAPTPRATIELHRDPSAPHFPSRLRVDTGRARVFRPMVAANAGPFRVIEPEPNDVGVELASTSAAAER